jgi:hypothetical protein
MYTVFAVYSYFHALSPPPPLSHGTKDLSLILALLFSLSLHAIVLIDEMQLSLKYVVLDFLNLNN